MDRFREITNRRKSEEPQRKQRYDEDSKKQLQRIARKKITTAFIGALAKFEAYFGHLWGQELPDSECTENQLKWRDFWEQCRTEVLDNGNHQSRAFESELQQYTVKWNRHQMKFGANGGGDVNGNK